MASNNEPAKLLLPYLQRADELQNHEPLVAYYCRLYAMERGLMIPQNNRTETTKSILVSLMKQLEKDKKSIKLGPDDNLHVEGFALNVFAKADKQDRAGRADLSTAKTFYAANIFFEILNQFGELQPDIEQKQKYAAWKAADIRKAVKEGRKPIPGGPGGDNDSSLPSSASSEHDLQPNRDDFADSSTRADSTARTAPDSDSSPRQYSHDNIHHFSSFSQPPSNVTPPPSLTIPPSHYAGNNYSSETIHLPPTTNNSEHSISHQPHHHQPQPHFPQQYPSHDASPYSYPNFQSYPSFSESSLPSAPSHYPSHYQGSDASYTSLSPSNAAPYVSTPQYNSSGRNGNAPEVSPTATERYEYDSNYQPPPEKIAEAHKAARFAVGALAFDDVSTAVDYLKKSLELLTNPSADH